MDSTLSTLNSRKEAFLGKLQAEIDTYIVSRRSHCIDVVERDSSSEKILRTHAASLDPDFAEVLYKFVRVKTYNGHKLDSALTEPVSDIVCRQYQAFYEANGDVVSAGIIESMTSNDMVLKAVLDKVAEKVLSKSAKHLRDQVVQQIVHQVHDTVAAGTLHTVGHQVSTAAAHAACSTVGTMVVHVLLKLLAAHIGTIIAKIMSSALVKKIVAAALSKCVYAVVVGFMATHVGAAAGGISFAWILLPALVAYLGYKINTFPGKLGEKVSKAVRGKMSESFYGMNKDILDKILDEVVNGEKLVMALADNQELRGMMQDMVKNL